MYPVYNHYLDEIIEIQFKLGVDEKTAMLMIIAREIYTLTEEVNELKRKLITKNPVRET